MCLSARDIKYIYLEGYPHSIKSYIGGYRKNLLGKFHSTEVKYFPRVRAEFCAFVILT